MLLIVVNFDNMPACPGIKIPKHAFDYLNIPVKEKYVAKELLSGNLEELAMSPDQLTHVKLEGHSGKILKIGI